MNPYFNQENTAYTPMPQQLVKSPSPHQSYPNKQLYLHRQNSHLGMKRDQRNYQNPFKNPISPLKKHPSYNRMPTYQQKPSFSQNPLILGNPYTSLIL